MEIFRQAMTDLQSDTKEAQDRAFTTLMNATKESVNWAYEAWADLVKLLNVGDNRQKAIASQVLCNLAKSDPKNKMLKDFDALLNVTRDEKFVTARHCMQSLWKIGIIGKKQQEKVLAGLELRFNECIAEKNCTLIRYDIIENLKKIFDHTKDLAIKEKALALIESEGDLRYRKKYQGLWKFS